MSQWNLEGMRVKGLYLDDIEVTGRVEQSRVKYGGSVQHTVVLDQTVNVYGQARDRVLVEHKDVLHISSS